MYFSSASGADGELINFTLINLTLHILGPMRERTLCTVLLVRRGKMYPSSFPWTPAYSRKTPLFLPSGMCTFLPPPFVIWVQSYVACGGSKAHYFFLYRWIIMLYISRAGYYFAYEMKFLRSPSSDRAHISSVSAARFDWPIWHRWFWGWGHRWPTGFGVWDRCYKQRRVVLVSWSATTLRGWCSAHDIKTSVHGSNIEPWCPNCVVI